LYFRRLLAISTIRERIKIKKLEFRNWKSLAFFVAENYFVSGSFNSLKHLEPIYIDETGFDTYFYREYGRSLKGQLIRCKVSGRRYQRISLVAGLTNGELIAPMTYEEAMTSDFFEA